MGYKWIIFDFYHNNVIHDRVFHDYLKDFNSELDIYQKGT